jgi:hypothetical protein
VHSLLLATILALPAHGFAVETSTFEILTVGKSFHGQEIKPSSTKGWLALYKTAGGFELAKVSLRIEPAFDAVVDDDSSKPTGKSVSVEKPRKDDPILLIHDSRLSTVHEGSVVGRIFNSNDGALFPGQTASINSKEAQILIEAFGSVSLDAASNGPIIKNYEILLNYQGLRQGLFKLGELHPPDYRQRLIWAGDLDQDGRLDFLLDLSGHYNETRTTLFLSSSAKAPDLVRPVAEFVSTGC